MTTKDERRSKQGWAPLGVRVHPQVHAELKIRAVRKRMTMEEYVHRLLCRDLGLKDLVKPVSE